RFRPQPPSGAKQAAPPGCPDPGGLAFVGGARHENPTAAENRGPAMRTRVISALAFAAAIIPTAALAHPGHDAHGLLHGFTHPFGGFDHLIAMVAVGLYA